MIEINVIILNIQKYEYWAGGCAWKSLDVTLGEFWSALVIRQFGPEIGPYLD